MNNRIHTLLIGLLASVAGMPAPALAQIATVESHHKILRTPELFPDEDPGGFTGAWPHALASLGDLDGAGLSTTALATGAHRTPLGIPTEEAGIVYIVFLDEQEQIIPGMVRQLQNPQAPSGDRFGQALSEIGDLDGDGVIDLAVGAPASKGGAFNAGTVWIFLLNPDGSVKPLPHEINSNTDMFQKIGIEDAFGTSITCLGMMNSPCGPKLAIAVGEPNDDDGGFNTGAVWILFLNTDGTVACSQKINSEIGGFEASLSDNDKFGFAVSALGDLDGDEIVDIAVAAPLDDHDTGNANADLGAIWVLFLNSDGTVHDQIRIIVDDLPVDAQFGSDLDLLGPLDPAHPERVTLAVGVPGRNGNINSVWLLELNPDGSLVRELQIGPDLEEFNSFDVFGIALSSMGDLDGNGFPDLAVAEPGDDEAGPNLGAFHILHLAAVNLDTDGDGVNDADDACPDSDLSPTIVIDGEDTGVSNDLLGDGCTISDLIANLLAQDSSTNVIVQFLVELKGEGIITGQEMGAILQSLNTP